WWLTSPEPVTSGRTPRQTRTSRTLPPVPPPFPAVARWVRPAVTATTHAGTAPTTSSTPPDTTSLRSSPARHPFRRNEHTVYGTATTPSSRTEARRLRLGRRDHSGSNRMSRE